MDTLGCGSGDRSKMTRKVKKCKRENSDGYIGGDESTDKEVSKQMALIKKDKSLYNCSHCSLIYRTVDELTKHLLTHQEKIRLPKSSGIIIRKEPKTKKKSLPTCKVIITRCDNLISPYQPIGSIHTLAANIQNEETTGKRLPRSYDLQPGKANSFSSASKKKLGKKRGKSGANPDGKIEESLRGRFSLNQTSDCGVTTKVVMKPYKCHLCSKSFTQQEHLKKHIQNHTGEQPHQCQLCSKSFGQLGSLKLHIRTHTGERPYRCQLCSKSFAQQGDLEKHIRTHTGERPYRCQLCSKLFTQQQNLKRHIRTHTGERPYQCQLCSRLFTQLGTLKTHIRTHTGERPYQCQLCSKSFTQQGSLKQHIRTHTGEQPHRCQLCYKSFAYLENLKRHIRTHTGTRLNNSEQSTD